MKHNTVGPQYNNSLIQMSGYNERSLSEINGVEFNLTYLCLIEHAQSGHAKQLFLHKVIARALDQRSRERK